MALYKLRKEIVSKSIPELKEMFDADWLKANYPELVRDKAEKGKDVPKTGKKLVDHL